MPRGRRTSYTRDNSGRFASTPGGGAPKRSTPATRRAATRAGNRLNRDNSGRISGIGRNGATVRGGRLKTAKGNKRATQLASMRPAGLRAGTIAKGGRGVSGAAARTLAAARKERMAVKPVAPAKALKRPTAPSVAKPAKKESKRNISDAKAGRIIARLDANRPGLRKATGSDRRNRNLLQTYDRASKFVLAASTRESKRSGGQSRMDLAESVRRAVRNAKAKAKPKPKPAILGRVPTKGPGRGPLMKARATPAKPSPKSPRIRARIEGSARPAGTVAKPRGMKPGVLAARRGVKAKPSVPGFAPKDFERRASRAFYNTKNPKVKERALALYKQMMDTSMAPSQVKKLMTTGKSYSTVKNKPKPARQRLSKGEREHRDMLALAGKLFR